MSSKDIESWERLTDSEVTDLWNQLGPRLRSIASRFLGAGRSVEDSEHIANAAFHSLIKRVKANGEAEKILDEEQRDGLWPIAIAIARNKAFQANREAIAEKRGGAMNRKYSEQYVDELADDPTLFAQLEELLVQLRDYTADDNVLRAIVQQRLEGRTSKQIAANLNVSESRVSRRLKELRKYLEELA